MNRIRIFTLSVLSLIGLSAVSAQAGEPWHHRPVCPPVVACAPVVACPPVVCPPAARPIHYRTPVVVCPPHHEYRHGWR